ncbi:MAG: hypothetical protein CTY31_06450 [Hyphomicrobium sp.]|nr:MAG: hypothetical protein CTY31_06450 [Hyphomicrobium sp.]
MSDAPRQQDTSSAKTIDAKLLELLVCPMTKTRLVYDAQAQELISRAAGLAFPIRNGVPLMIEDAARRLTDDDIKRL